MVSNLYFYGLPGKVMYLLSDRLPVSYLTRVGRLIAGNTFETNYDLSHSIGKRWNKIFDMMGLNTLNNTNAIFGIDMINLPAI